MKAEEALSVAKTYVNQVLVGMGALKGANCTIKSMTKSGRLTTTVFEWTDNDGNKQESTMLVYDGLDGADGADGAPGQTGPQGPEGPEGPEGPQGPAGQNGTNGTNGQDGADGADGFSPTIVVKTSSSSEYILTITDKNGSYDTPNLKGSGGGGGGASVLSDLTDVQLASLAQGDALVFNGSKWVNVSLATVATSGNYADLSTKPFDTIGTGLSVTSGALNANVSNVDLQNDGTASSTGVRSQVLEVNSLFLPINGTKYMEQTLTTDTANPTVYTFTSNEILADSVIDVYADTWGITPSSVVTTAGQCVVTIPVQSSAYSLKIRIYIK